MISGIPTNRPRHFPFGEKAWNGAISVVDWCVRHSRGCILGLSVGALLIRFVVGILYIHYGLHMPFQSGDEFFNLFRADSLIYNSIARAMLEGHGFSHNLFTYLGEGKAIGGGWYATAHYPPLYPLFLAVCYYFFGYNFWAILLPQALLGAFTILAVYLLGKNMFDTRVGLLSALLVTLHPQIVIFSSYNLTETGYFLLVTITFLSMLKVSRSPTMPRLIVAGCLSGIVALWRPAFLPFVPFALVWLALILRRRPWIALRSTIVVAVVFMTAIAPWIARNWIIFGEFIPISSESAHALWSRNNPDVFELKFTDDIDVFYSSGFDLSQSSKSQAYLERMNVTTNNSKTWAVLNLIRENPLGYLTRVARRFLDFWSPYRALMGMPHRMMAILTYVTIFPLAFAGIWLTRRQQEPLLMTLFIISAATLVALVADDWSNRLRLPIEPYLGIFASFALMHLIDVHRQRFEPLNSEVSISRDLQPTELERLTVLAISGLPLWNMGDRCGMSSVYWGQRGFVLAGHGVHFLVPGGEKHDEVYDGINVHYFRIPFNAFSPKNIWLHRLSLKIYWILFVLLGTRAALKIAREVRPDVTYGHTSFGAPIAWFVGVRHRIPNITRLYGTFLFPSLYNPLGLMGKFEEVLAFKLPCSHLIITDDGTGGLEVARRLNVPAQRVKFWRNGVNRFYDPDFNTAVFKKSIGLSSDQRMVLAVSRLAEWKRVDRLIAAIPQIVSELDEVVCVVLGDGPERRRLEGLTKTLGVTRHVRWMGAMRQNEVAKYMNATDLFVSLFDLSNASNAVLEAMSCGKCVVALDTGGTSKLIKNKETGILISPESLRDLPLTLIDLLKDDNLRERIGAQAIQFANRNILSWEARAQKEVELVEELVKLNGQSGSILGHQDIT